MEEYRLKIEVQANGEKWYYPQFRKLNFFGCGKWKYIQQDGISRDLSVGYKEREMAIEAYENRIKFLNDIEGKKVVDTVYVKLGEQ